MTGGDSRGIFKGRSDTLEQMERLFMEDRTDRTIDAEGLGDEFLRQPGLEEYDGLSAQRRHLGKWGKGVWREDNEKKRLEMMRTELTLTHQAFISDGQGDPSNKQEQNIPWVRHIRSVFQKR
jgi:hypothetical protein